MSCACMRVWASEVLFLKSVFCEMWALRSGRCLYLLSCLSGLRTVSSVLTPGDVYKQLLLIYLETGNFVSLGHCFLKYTVIESQIFILQSFQQHNPIIKNKIYRPSVIAHIFNPST